jgi:3-hydroxybutyryl-CoA dehydratase
LTEISRSFRAENRAAQQKKEDYMRTIDTIQVGDSASFTKTVTETDIILYAGITGDLNPAHINAEAAKEGMFGQRIAHGMLSAGFISCVLGMYLPGPGTIYLGQELKFTNPVYIGDTVTATATVVERIEEKNRLVLDTIVTNQNGDVVIKGKATVMPPRAAAK